MLPLDRFSRFKTTFFLCSIPALNLCPGVSILPTPTLFSSSLLNKVHCDYESVSSSRFVECSLLRIAENFPRGTETRARERGRALDWPFPGDGYIPGNNKKSIRGGFSPLGRNWIPLFSSWLPRCRGGALPIRSRSYNTIDSTTNGEARNQNVSKIIRHRIH